MKIKIEQTTCWFLATAFCNLVYSAIVKFFLKNPDLAEHFSGMHHSFYVSGIYIIIGLIWLVSGGLYTIADNSRHFRFTPKSKKLHFFLTIAFIICLMLLPVLETCFPTSGANRSSWYSEVFGYFLPLTVLAFLGGIVVYVINLLTAVFSLITKK